MNFDVQDKIALVTGANRGIGKSIVESLFAHGAAKVYAAVRNLESLSELTSKYGDKLIPVQVDVAKAESIAKLAETAQDVQLLVNNAGILRSADPLSDHVEESFRQELEVNTFGLIRMAKAFAPILEKNSPSALVQLNSVASIKNFTDFTTYSASKAATYSITQGLRDVLKPKGVTVLSVHPGPIATDMADDAGFREIAEPASVVSEAIVSALKAGDFHVFPDTTARDIQGVYQSFATNVIEAEAAES